MHELLKKRIIYFLKIMNLGMIYKGFLLMKFVIWTYLVYPVVELVSTKVKIDMVIFFWIFVKVIMFLLWTVD